MVSPDFRSEPMDSPEGKGLARRAWESYTRTVDKRVGPKLRPVLEPVAKKVAAPITLDLVGFWLTWHLQGGFEGLLALGMSRTAIYRRIKAFREMFGAHPDEFEMPGVAIDVATYRTTPNPFKAARSR